MEPSTAHFCERDTRGYACRNYILFIFLFSSLRRPDDGRKVGHPRWTTSGVSSFARLKWAVNDMGATPTLAWCCAAAKRGDEVLVCTQCALCYIHYGLGVAWDVRVCSAAASGGHLAMLQWLHAQGCPWDEWACAYAAEYGHLATLQWLRSHGCPEY